MFADRRSQTLAVPPWGLRPWSSMSGLRYWKQTWDDRVEAA
jgi:hypothetical protein